MEGFGLQYAEGFALASDKRIFFHAWVVGGDGCAVDVTIPDEEPVAYFGAVVADPKLGNARTPLGNLAYAVSHGQAEMPPALRAEQLMRRELGLAPEPHQGISR